MDYEVRSCLTDDETELVRIYRDIFEILDGVDIDKTTERFVEKIRSGRVLVADSGEILGFAGYDTVRNIPPSLVDGTSIDAILNRELYYARHPEDRQELMAYLQGRQNEIGHGDIIVESFDNEFIRRDTVVSLDDVYCMGTAVVPKLQQNGVGWALIKAREQAARDLGASTLYVHCWCGGNSPKAHYDLGFQPILKTGPEYEDGSASLLFGKLLR